MKISRSYLAYFYIAAGIFALIFTWAHTPHYLGDGIVEGNLAFWEDALLHANPANKFLATDIFFFAFAADVWMVIESRRLHIPYVWGYIAVGIFIAISFAFPLFLAAREKAMARSKSRGADDAYKMSDIIGLVFLGVLTLVVSISVL